MGMEICLDGVEVCPSKGVEIRLGRMEIHLGGEERPLVYCRYLEILHAEY